MALINCPECNKEISNTSNSCIGCGYKMVTKKNKMNWIQIAGICIFVFGSGLSYVLGSVFKVIVDYYLRGVDLSRGAPIYGYNWALFTIGVILSFLIGLTFFVIGYIQNKKS